MSFARSSTLMAFILIAVTHMSCLPAPKDSTNSTLESPLPAADEILATLVRLEGKSVGGKASKCAGVVIGADEKQKTIAIVTAAQCETPQKIGFGLDGDQDICPGPDAEKKDHPDFRKGEAGLKLQPEADVALVVAHCKLPASQRVATIAENAYFPDSTPVTLATFREESSPTPISLAVQWNGALEAASLISQVLSVKSEQNQFKCVTTAGSPSFLKNSNGNIFLVGISQGSTSCDLAAEYTWLRGHKEFLLKSAISEQKNIASSLRIRLTSIELIAPQIRDEVVLEEKTCVKKTRSEIYSFCSAKFQKLEFKPTGYSLTRNETVKCSLMTPAEALQKLQSPLGIPYENACGNFWCAKSSCDAIAIKNERVHSSTSQF